MRLKHLAMQTCFYHLSPYIFSIAGAIFKRGICDLKGQCHDIQGFFALFLREQKMAVARASVTDIDLKAWLSARPGSLATYAGC